MQDGLEVRNMPAAPTFSVVVPVYNEGEGLLAFHDRLAR